jgi:ATP-dependent exoDNAse (exonuclease V) beta subunit
MDTSKFVVLEASAGSGKTHNLAKRYISLLLDFDSSKTKPPLSNILALTFTNKATIEMKERIIKYLKKISLGQDVKDVLTAVNIPKTKIPSNADIVVNYIINNFDHFNVRTIDSFINLIIKACALKLGVSPNYEILDSYEDYIDYSTDVFLDKSFSDKKVKEVLDAFFEQYIIDNTSSWSIRGNILETFKKLYKKEITKKIVEIKKKVKYFEELPKLNNVFVGVCKKILETKQLEKISYSKYVTYINKVVFGEKSLFTEDISTYCYKDEYPYLKSALPDKRNSDLEQLYFKAKDIISSFMEFKAKHFYDNYIKMFDSILKEFEIRAKLDSVMFLQDINKQVSKVFYEQDLAPEIYLSLSNNFTDFLIDEFQDTNQTQWQTLKLIVEENLSKGGSFFYVGDKKQAIYGFRGGDYKIFDVPRIEFANYFPQLTVLDTNYRSCKAIVDFNNKLYYQDNIVKLLNYIGKNKGLTNIEKYCEGIVEVFKDSEQKCNTQESGYVEIAYKEYGEEDDIDEVVKQYLYETIDDVTKRFSKKDITIICRKNKEIEKIGRWLLEKDIDIESFQTLNIINSQRIKELFSILQVLNMPTDNISFVSFITSEIFLKITGLKKEDMFKFITDNSLETVNNNLYIKFRKAYPKVWQDYIEDFFDRAGFVAVYEMVVSLISKYKVMENFKEYSNVIYRFLEIICDFEKTNQGLQNFIDYFNDFEKNEKNEKFFIKVPSSDAIKITTIHKSKGLEYNVVIMPYFYIQQDGKTDNIFPVENEQEVSFLNIKQTMTGYSQYLKDIYYEKYFKDISNELNGLYVSTTRAIFEFYALITHKNTKTGSKKSYIETFIDEHTRCFGVKGKAKSKSRNDDEEIVKNMEITSTKLQDIVDIINDSSLEIYGKKHKDILLNGKIIHYALSQIETFNFGNLQSKIEKAVENTQLVYPDQDLKIFKEKLLSLLSNKEIASLFDERNIVFNEKEYVDKFGNTVRTDKIIIKPKEVCVVDFKSSIYDKEYINNQMKKYIEILKEIYTDKEVTCCIVDIENEKLHDFNTGIE